MKNLGCFLALLVAIQAQYQSFEIAYPQGAVQALINREIPVVVNDVYNVPLPPGKFCCYNLPDSVHANLINMGIKGGSVGLSAGVGISPSGMYIGGSFVAAAIFEYRVALHFLGCHTVFGCKGWAEIAIGVNYAINFQVLSNAAGRPVLVVSGVHFVLAGFESPGLCHIISSHIPSAIVKAFISAQAELPAKVEAIAQPYLNRIPTEFIVSPNTAVYWLLNANTHEYSGYIVLLGYVDTVSRKTGARGPFTPTSGFPPTLNSVGDRALVRILDCVISNFIWSEYWVPRKFEKIVSIQLMNETVAYVSVDVAAPPQVFFKPNHALINISGQFGVGPSDSLQGRWAIVDFKIECNLTASLTNGNHLLIQASDIELANVDIQVTVLNISIPITESWIYSLADSLIKTDLLPVLNGVLQAHTFPIPHQLGAPLLYLGNGYLEIEGVIDVPELGGNYTGVGGIIRDTLTKVLVEAAGNVNAEDLRKDMNITGSTPAEEGFYPQLDATVACPTFSKGHLVWCPTARCLP